MIHGKLVNLGAEKAKRHGFDWQQGYAGPQGFKAGRKITSGPQVGQVAI